MIQTIHSTTNGFIEIVISQHNQDINERKSILLEIYINLFN